jgi:hypothetical protein
MFIFCAAMMRMMPPLFLRLRGHDADDAAFRFLRRFSRHCFAR